MNCKETALQGVYLIETDVFQDNRGWLTESYSHRSFAALGIDTVFVQDNYSFSKNKYTLRGLHFQNEPMAQSKLIRCIRGKILDVMVDLRPSSPQYLKWDSLLLSDVSSQSLFIPKGFAHGFLTLIENTEILYKTDAFYAPELDRSIRYDDPAIAIDWGVEHPILSEKDRNAPFLCDCDCNYG